MLELSHIPNKGQKEYNERYLKNSGIIFSDHQKEEALKYAFVNSRVLLVYGAAGTGKTTLLNMISTMLIGRRKLFLTKTHTALQNLRRRIENPGADADFISINSFTKKVSLPDYDVIFVDECSTIDNRVMKAFLEKMRPDSFIVLAGDTYQIESIDFGNWFSYAKDVINVKGSNIELLSNWRTEDQSLRDLWKEVRNKGALITEKLVIDGPFSENIGESIFNSDMEDEVILCLNYDGKFGLNNMNNYFQNANTAKSVSWRDWTYKVGDHIRNKEEQRAEISDEHRREIKEYLDALDLTVDIDIQTLPVGREKNFKTVFTQPGIRYSQAKDLVQSLLFEDEFQTLSTEERNAIIERILSDIKGRMMEDIVLLETKIANPKKHVFGLQFAVGEFDMVVSDEKYLTCEVYEIKHSKEKANEQFRYLIDEEKLKSTEFRYGKITKRTVIYRGENTTLENGIEYRNVEDYLKSLR